MRVLVTTTLLAATASAFVPIGRPSVNGLELKSVREELAKLDLPSADDFTTPAAKVDSPPTSGSASQKRSDAPAEQLPKVITLPLHRRAPRKSSSDPIAAKVAAAASAASRYLSRRQEAPSPLPAPDPPTADSLGIAQDGNDFSYFSTVRFGSSQKAFELVIDTGSADTWIPSANCPTAACDRQTTFSADDSSTISISDRRTFEIAYGAGNVNGVVAYDNITFADFNIRANFGLATNVSDEFVSFQIDGILGLGFPESSAMRAKTVMEELKDQGQIEQRIYGIALSRASSGINDGAINFGGIDPDLFEGELTFTNSRANGLWELPMGDVQVGNTTLQLRGGRTAVIDTGTSLMIVPPNDAMRLHGQFSEAYYAGTSTFIIPCNVNENITIAFSGKSFNIPPMDFVGEPAFSEDGKPQIGRSGDRLCVSLIDGRTLLDSTTWLLGDVFLKNVYSVFDLDARRIGFGVRKTRQAEDDQSRNLEGLPPVQETDNTDSSSEEDQEEETDAAAGRVLSWGVMAAALGVAMYGCI